VLLGEFDGAGVDVIGASIDPEELNAEFREKEQLEYGLVSDTTHELANQLGLIEEMGENRVLRAARYTYLLEPDGTIVEIWQVGKGELIDTHPDEVLDFVRKLPV
jgi:peroxiredoxin Q/BCP